jgi:hypothetical protein
MAIWYECVESTLISRVRLVPEDTGFDVTVSPFAAFMIGFVLDVAVC